MTRRRWLLGTMWGFVALAFLAGVVLGAVLPLWQRAALQNDVRVLEKRLDAKDGAVEKAQQEVEELKGQIVSLETSAEALAVQNSELTSEVVSLRAAQQAAPAASAAQQQQQAATGGAPAIVERSVSPSQVNAGDSVTLLVKTTGATDKVTMRIDGPSGSSYDYTFSLKKVGTEGDVSVWRTVLKAPPGAGTYRCIAAAARGSRRTTASTIHLTVN